MQNNIERVIGRLEQGIFYVKEQQDKMSIKLDLLIEEHYQRKGAVRLVCFASTLLGAAGGLAAGFIRSVF